MTRTVGGERLFGVGEKEMLRKMIWQAAEFCGVEVLTYCVMSNHFHVLVRVPEGAEVADAELLRRYKVLYPKPTKYQTASIAVMQRQLAEGGEEADAIRRRLLARMGDVSEFMKTVKQRFSVWYNRTHQRYGTLWAERFKSVLVEGRGNPLQTMAAYIDLNPVRAGLVKDPKDYRFCGYAEAVAGLADQKHPAVLGLRAVWAAYANGDPRDGGISSKAALQCHRTYLFGSRGGDSALSAEDHARAVKVLEKERGVLPKATVLRCRVRYFTDGAILGTRDYVSDFIEHWQIERARKRPPKVNPLRGAAWGDLNCIQGLRKQVFG
jgi:hypothetical protein